MVAAISPADINYEETLSTLRHVVFLLTLLLHCNTPYIMFFIIFNQRVNGLQCFDAVGWAAGRAPGL